MRSRDTGLAQMSNGMNKTVQLCSIFLINVQSHGGQPFGLTLTAIGNMFQKFLIEEGEE
jgi:hypothetical protein